MAKKTPPALAAKSPLSNARAPQLSQSHLLAALDLFCRFDPAHKRRYQRLRRIAQVWCAVLDGYATREEIASYTNIPKQTVHRQLQLLLEQQLIRRTLASAEVRRSGDTRTCLYWPLE